MAIIQGVFHHELCVAKVFTLNRDWISIFVTSFLLSFLELSGDHFEDLNHKRFENDWNFRLRNI